jgi:hypothetical protein
MCDAQRFVDHLPHMPGFRLNCAPEPVRQGLKQFSPLLRMRVFRVLTAWTIRVCSPAYEPIAAETFLLAVPVARGCWAATFDARRLWLERPALPAAAEIAFDLLNRIAYGSELNTRGLLHTLARSAVDDPAIRGLLVRAFERDAHACVFVGSLTANRRQRRQLGALTIPIEKMRKSWPSVLPSDAPVPPYAQAIYDGAIGPGRCCFGAGEIKFATVAHVAVE